ncbi:SDR family oxidoreductase [Polynucleobacter sp. AM-7D1]|uniref:dTDP-4-dehydrorhamnose reductase family protein n=1 Tax=Polynucleobacter sp. AM-7D1 TaxID=2689102 RepID=UPI001BFD2083|nr:SDR family oxidoreductase [Polynucleobacter sp. AM-7D1]QWE29008.1 SDR family oxidoreductase [Polynucleobacter sp. AM-7D1]
MKNVLVLGANGLIGSTLYRVLRKSNELKAYGTVRRNSIFFQNDDHIESVDAFDIQLIYDLLIKKNIHVIVNCIGLTKHKESTNSIFESGYLNAVFPHKLAFCAQKSNARLIHISSDCVFSGKDGNYDEGSKCDAIDIYGITKYLGEPSEIQGLTIRTSTIGHELASSYGLLDWFITQKRCSGYSNALFSGTTTLELANNIKRLILKHPNLSGIYNIGGEKISKFDLLTKINTIYKLGIDIKFDESLIIDRSYSSDKYYKATGYTQANWDDLIIDMKEEFLASKL